MRALFRKKNKKTPFSVTKSSPQVPPEAHIEETTNTTDSIVDTDARSLQKYKATSDISEHFFGLIKEISEATDLLSPLKAACALLIRGITLTRAMHNNEIDWAELCDELRYHQVQLEGHRDGLEKGLSTEDVGCLKALEYYMSVVAKVVERATKYDSNIKTSGESSTLIRFGTAQKEKDEVSRHREMVENAWQIYTIALHGAIATQTARIEKEFEMQAKASHQLPSPGRIHDNYGDIGSNLNLVHGDKVEVCEEGTRQEVLNAIGAWAEDAETEKRIFWLNDAAGTGKSTIAATMARKWSLDNRLAGRFFFSLNSSVTRTAKQFCRAVAEDIAGNQHTLASVIREAIESFSQEHHVWFDVQLRRLVFEPLQRLVSSHCVFLVVDAVDNCVDAKERADLLNGFIRTLPSFRQVKLLLTSRPLQDISVILNASPIVHGSDIQLLDVRNPSYSDIVIYVEKKLKSVANISPEHRAMIITNSGGLFLYAATVCRMLEKSRRRLEVLNILSELRVTGRVEATMDKLYLSALNQARMDEHADHFLMSVLSMIIIAYQPISINTISRFLPKNVQVDSFVQDLAGVLKDGDPDRPIRVLHQTFREFVLSNQERANGFLVNPRTSSITIATACISTLEQMLEYDVFRFCNTNKLPPRNSEVVDLDSITLQRMTAAERYASVFWANHVAESEISTELWIRVLIFLSQKLLNWVELMSWRGTMVSCVEGLSWLYRSAVRHRSMETGVLTARDIETVRHAYQFVVRHQAIISEAALQTYSVALFFTPLQSTLFGSYRKRYRSLLPTVTTSHLIRWSGNATIGGYADRVTEMVLSPDGNYLVTIGVEGKLCLWSVETGSPIGQPFQRAPLVPVHNAIDMCIFSSDGKRFTFRVHRNELYIFDSKRGEAVVPSMQMGGSSGKLAVTPTLSYVVSSGRPISIWDVERQKEVHIQDKVEPMFEAGDIAISPNGEAVVAIGHFVNSNKRDFYRDLYNTQVYIALWDLETFERRGPYALVDGSHHSLGRENHISFSPDSTRFAVWLNGGSISLREGSTGEEVSKFGDSELKMNMDPISVVFSPSNQHFAYPGISSSSKCIIIREQSTGHKVSTLPGIPFSIEILSFSSDGRRLAAVSYNQPIHVWDVLSGEPLRSIFTGSVGRIYKCTLSADWGAFATVSQDHEIRVYNLREGNNFGESDTHNGIIEKLIRKPIAGPSTGPLLATRVGRCNVRLWNTTTAETYHQFMVDDNSIVPQVAFSSEGRMVAAICGISFVYVWSVETLTLLRKLNHSSGTQGEGSLSFSSDSSLLVACRGGLVRIWNTSTMTRIFQWDNWKEGIYYMLNIYGLSCDDTWLAGENRREIHVLNIRTKTQISSMNPSAHIFEGYLGSSGAMSPTDASLLAVNRYANPEPSLIELWRIGEELQLVGSLALPEVISPRISFSQDGYYIACGLRCIEIMPNSLRLYAGNSPPESFRDSGFRTSSFLAYHDGWIHSGFPRVALMPIPVELQAVELDQQMLAYGESIVIMSNTDDPILVDCSPLLARARRGELLRVKYQPPDDC